MRNAALSLAKPFVTASRMAEDAKTTADEATVERRVAELSALAEIKYVVVRASAARELGILVCVLDKLVSSAFTSLSKLGVRRPASARAAPSRSPSSSRGPRPWTAQPCSTSSWRRCGRYVVLTSLQAVAVALWIAFSHVHDAFDVSPRLFVKSLLKRSGKTTLFTVCLPGWSLDLEVRRASLPQRF